MKTHTAKRAGGAQEAEAAGGVSAACRRLMAAAPDATLRDLAKACAGDPGVFNSYPQTVLKSAGAAAGANQSGGESAACY
jgi:hypothetical protein